MVPRVGESSRASQANRGLVGAIPIKRNRYPHRSGRGRKIAEKNLRTHKTEVFIESMGGNTIFTCSSGPKKDWNLEHRKRLGKVWHSRAKSVRIYILP